MESKCRAMKKQRTQRDWPHRLAQPGDQQHCKLLPFDDGKQRRKQGDFRGDNYLQPDAHRARRKGESLVPEHRLKTAAI